MTFRMWLLIPVISLAICSCNSGISKQEADLERNIDAYDASNRGQDKYMSKDYYGAIADFTEAIRLNPNLVDAYNVRGYSKSMLKDYYGAIADYTEAIRLDPNSARVYRARGYEKYMLGDKQGSREDLNQAAILYKQQGNTVEYEKLRKELTDRFNASP